MGDIAPLGWSDEAPDEFFDPETVFGKSGVETALIAGPPQALDPSMSSTIEAPYISLTRLPPLADIDALGDEYTLHDRPAENYEKSVIMQDHSTAPAEIAMASGPISASSATDEHGTWLRKMLGAEG